MKRIPAEWEPHEAVWLAWPSHEDLWEEKLKDVQSEFTALCHAVAEHPGERAERLEILARTPTDLHAAGDALDGLECRIHRAPYGDVWLRDTAPVFALGEDALDAHRFRFNGWGGRYLLPGDPDVAPFIAAQTSATQIDHALVAEGGALEFDGEGTLLTTRSCLLNRNRNSVDENEATEILRHTLGVERVLWLDEGLANDHTDGHIDTLVRFVAPGEVVCMEPGGIDDPNREALSQVLNGLQRFTDASGRKLGVHTVPSPGRVVDDTGELMPASYVNFYIANTTVVVPTYGIEQDDAAVARIASLFPERRVVGVSARALLHGGGAFHCITQQQPRIS